MKPEPLSIHLIGGPTASGKTALALEIARRENGVVINADAMQVYTGLPVLTAQPTAAEKAGIPHELFEIFDVSEKSSVGRWLPLAKDAIERALQAGRTPIVVGGTGLYFRALTQGIAEIPPIPESARAESAARYDRLGEGAFRDALRERDPESASRIERGDSQRLIRADEVVRHTGQTLGEWHAREQGAGFKGRESLFRPHLLLPEREALYAACDARFLRMVAQGAIEEVRALMTREIDPGLPSMKILGARQLAAHLRGELPLEDAIAKAQQLTRHYAKRQMTWFRNQGLGVRIQGLGVRD